MKKILLILITLFITAESFSQLNLDYFEQGNGSNNYHETIKGLVDIIYGENPSLISHTIMDGYTFDDGMEIKFVIFKGENRKFLDFIFFVKKPNIRWEIETDNNLQHSLDRKIVDYNTNFDDRCKIIFDDESYITIEFNSVKYLDYKTGRKDKTYRYMVQDHVTEKKYKFQGFAN